MKIIKIKLSLKTVRRTKSRNRARAQTNLRLSPWKPNRLSGPARSWLHSSKIRTRQKTLSRMTMKLRINKLIASTVASKMMILLALLWLNWSKSRRRVGSILIDNWSTKRIKRSPEMHHYLKSFKEDQPFSYRNGMRIRLITARHSLQSLRRRAQTWTINWAWTSLWLPLYSLFNCSEALVKRHQSLGWPAASLLIG